MYAAWHVFAVHCIGAGADVPGAHPLLLPCKARPCPLGDHRHLRVRSAVGPHSLRSRTCSVQHAAYNMHHTTSACTYSVVGHSVRSRLTLSRGVADAPQHEIDPIWHVIPCSMVQHTFTSHRRATLYVVCLCGVRGARHSVGTTTWSTQSGARKFRRSRSKSRTSRVLQGHYSKGAQWVLNGYR